jgi:hypothetical protein
VEQEMLEIPRDRFLPFDLKKPFRLDQQFDLVLSLEIAEHLPGECAETFIDSLTRLGPVIVFSAAIPFQRGTHHINEQWPDYWVKFFQAKNFVVIDCLRKKIWQNDNVQWYYAQNILLFVRQDYLDHSSQLQEQLEQNSANQLCMVHPKKYLAEIEWMRKLLLITYDLALLIPGKDKFVLVDQESFRTELPFGSRAIPFPERDGQYWGLPADDAAAINELERLRHLGATFIVLGWPAFWWLDYYCGFHRHLQLRFRCLIDNDRLVLFDLRS